MVLAPTNCIDVAFIYSIILIYRARVSSEVDGMVNTVRNTAESCPSPFVAVPLSAPVGMFTTTGVVAAGNTGVWIDLPLAPLVYTSNIAISTLMAK